VEELSLGQLPGFIETNSDGEDDLNGWITPSNVDVAKEMMVNGSVTGRRNEIPSVSCMTDDFAMQVT
jgi:RNA-binding protein NOB1